MIKPIVQYGNPVLRMKCAPVTEVTEEVRKLASHMMDTMRDAEGIGLAAPQIGKSVQLAIVDVSHDPECISYLRVNGEDAAMGDIMPLTFINPKLEPIGEREGFVEGCLSFDEIRGEVFRPLELKATLTTLEGETLVIETDGLFARAIQHEVDHLNGILFIDRMSSAAKSTLRGKLRRLQKAGKKAMR